MGNRLKYVYLVCPVNHLKGPALSTLNFARIFVFGVSRPGMTQISLNSYMTDYRTRVLLQTVKTQMKCSIMLHFIRVYTVCKGKKDLQTKEYNIFVLKIIIWHPRKVQWTIPTLLYISNQKEEYISIHRVKGEPYLCRVAPLSSVPQT